MENYRNQYVIFKKMYTELYKKNKFFEVKDAIKWMDKNYEKLLSQFN